MPTKDIKESLLREPEAGKGRQKVFFRLSFHPLRPINTASVAGFVGMKGCKSCNKEVSVSLLPMGNT